MSGGEKVKRASLLSGGERVKGTFLVSGEEKVKRASLVSGGERVKRASLVSGFSLFLLITNKETQTMSVAVSVCVVWFHTSFI